MGDLSQDEARTKHGQISAAFSPAAPVSRKSLFAGRTEQIGKLVEVVYQTGRHGIIYGERGVGKTSLAAVMADILRVSSGEDQQILTARANCDGTDDYSSMWRKVFDQIQFREERDEIGFTDRVSTETRSLSELLPSDEETTPADVTRVLRMFANGSLPVLFFDEFDRVEDDQTKELLSDTIKAASDQLIEATVVLVGVADSVEELIEWHQSIERAVAQIRIPRMSQDELGEIIDKGLEQAEMEISGAARDRILQLSQGLPHYTHLLAQAAARHAVNEGRLRVVLEDVSDAIADALEDAQQTIARAYHDATASPRETIYPEVLLACAVTEGDQLGYFAAGDIRKPLSRIQGKKYEIPAFSRHLHDLSEERGPVLEKTGEPRRYRFRFRNPLLQPYVIMRGLAEGMIDAEALADLTGMKAPEETT